VKSLWEFVHTIGTVLFAFAYPRLMDASDHRRNRIPCHSGSSSFRFEYPKRINSKKTSYFCIMRYYVNHILHFLLSSFFIQRIFSTIRYFDEINMKMNYLTSYFVGSIGTIVVAIVTLCNDSRNMQNLRQDDIISLQPFLSLLFLQSLLLSQTHSYWMQCLIAQVRVRPASVI